jgi:hypothetical protein
MTPLQAAKEHCANWDCGACLGMYYKDDLSVDWSRYSPRSTCLLAEGKRCPYFEEIVVPMRISRETAQAKTRADKKDAVVQAYLTLHQLIPSETKAKRMCLECRRVEVYGRERFCQKCRRRRKRASYRLSKRRSRLDVQKLDISLVRAEALTSGAKTAGYIDPAGMDLVHLTNK